MDEIRGERFEVLEVKKGERVKKAPLPFTTSTLTAGGIQDIEFPDLRRRCVLPSSSMRALTSRDRERSV